MALHILKIKYTCAIVSTVLSTPRITIVNKLKTEILKVVDTLSILMRALSIGHGRVKGFHTICIQS